MGFLDNSGDIILDAVLTDTGRKAMANGNFRIAQFALADDEIDYGLYDADNANGSAYYDTAILQTPVLEAFTDNRASMKSKLVSIATQDILYLPILKVNTIEERTQKVGSSGTAFDGLGATATGFYVVTVNNSTFDTLFGAYSNASFEYPFGVIDGTRKESSRSFVRIDQGTMGTDSTGQLTDLRESAYLIEIDSRLGSLCQHRPDDGVNTVRTATENFIDDDHIATYLITNTSWNDSVRNMSNQETEQTPIDGQLGSTLSFSIQSNTNLATSDALFNRIGYTATLGSTACRVIETTIRVTGYTTGYSVDLPFMFIKKQ